MRDETTDTAKTRRRGREIMRVALLKDEELRARIEKPLPLPEMPEGELEGEPPEAPTRRLPAEQPEPETRRLPAEPQPSRPRPDDEDSLF